MKMIEKGAPQLIKQSDGTYRLEVPVDFEFDDDEERREVEEAFAKVIADRRAELTDSD